MALKKETQLKPRQQELCSCLWEVLRIKGGLPKELADRLEFIRRQFAEVGGCGEVIIAREEYYEDSLVRWIENLANTDNIEWPEIK